MSQTRSKALGNETLQSCDMVKLYSRSKSSAANNHPPRRLTGLVRIGIDETSYKKGHKYITVTVNHDTNAVVWAAPGHPKLDDAEAAAAKELKSWLWWASHSRIPVICNLARKIRRHQQHIFNTIRPGLSNARIEAINNKIKRIIRKAYSFRNIDHMIDLIYFYARI